MSRSSDVALFGILAALWGLSFPVISLGLEYLPPVLFAAFRYDVAAVIMLAVAAWRVDEWIPTGARNLLAVTGGGAFLVAGNGLLFVGQQTVPSGVAAILQALVPIATAIWALVLLNERLSSVGAIGVALGFLGIGLVVQPDPGNLLGGDTLGRLIIVAQVISVSLGGVIVQWANPTIGRTALTGWSMLVGALLLHGASAGLSEGVSLGPDPYPPVAAVLYLGIFSTAIAFFIYFTFLEEHGAFEAGLVTYAVPIVATLVGVVVLGETISALSLLGFVIVALGFGLMKRHAVAEVLEVATGIGRP